MKNDFKDKVEIKLASYLKLYFNPRIHAAYFTVCSWRHQPEIFLLTERGGSWFNCCRKRKSNFDLESNWCQSEFLVFFAVKDVIANTVSFTKTTIPPWNFQTKIVCRNTGRGLFFKRKHGLKGKRWWGFHETLYLLNSLHRRCFCKVFSSVNFTSRSVI